MTDWAMVAILASLFFWGLARGTTICLSVCVPGLLPYLAEKPRSAWDGAKFGLLLCLPRMAIFVVIGLIWGAVSYTLFASRAFEDAVPSVPPGFEPVDVSVEVEQIRARKARELEQQVGTEMYWRRVTPERRMRARYGAATWNMYEPFH